MRYNWIRFACAALLAAVSVVIPGISHCDDTKEPPKDVAKELESKLTNRTPEEVIGVMNQLAQEWSVRKGGVEVAHQRFKKAAGEHTQSVEILANLKKTDLAQIPLILNAADVDRAIKVAQQHADFHATRVKQLEAVSTSIAKLSKLGDEFDNAVNSLNEQRETIALAEKITRKTPDALTKKQLDADTARVKTLTAEVKKACDDAKASTGEHEAALKTAKVDSANAATKLEELKRNRDALHDAFTYETKVKEMKPEQLTSEFNRLRKELAEKTGAIKANADDYAKAANAANEARAKLDAIKEPPIAPEEKLDAALPPLEKAARKLFATQQQYGALLRTINETEGKAQGLLAALDELETKSGAYSATLERARTAATQLASVAAEFERRVGRGELDAARVPEGFLQVVGTSNERAKLETDAASVRDAIAKLKDERNELRRPNSERENIKSLIAALHAQVGERIDLLTDLKKLAADYATAPKDRSESERKRIDQRAVERMAREGEEWEPFFALDRSKPGSDMAALLEAYYKELIELDAQEDNLRRRKETLEKLVKLTDREADDIAKLQAILKKRGKSPLSPNDWEEWFEMRLSPNGLKTEASAYHNEADQLNVIGGANARRVMTLTGTAPQTSGKDTRQAEQAATGGEIAVTRGELKRARIRGLTITGIKIALVLLGALILPRLIVFILRRAIRGGSDDAGNPSPALSALLGALKIGAWVAALALTLSILGFDVTALIIALAIAVLAVALAARPMIADVLGSIVIFAERRFKVGDVVRLGGSEPARIVGLTWRSTTLKTINGLELSVPNRTVTETTVENMSRAKETYDSLLVTVSTDKDAAKVIGVIRTAMAQCKNLSADHGVSVVSYNQKELVKVVQYRFWWFLKDYEMRNKTRDEVFARVALGLVHEDMSGIELTMA